MAFDKTINFMGVRKYTNTLSILIILISLAAISINGLKLGLDFTGGTQLEVRFDQSVDLDKVRTVLDEEGLKSPLAVYFGSDRDIMIRTQDEMKPKATEYIGAKLAAFNPSFQIAELRRPTREYEIFADVILVSGATVEALESANLFPRDQYGAVEYTDIEGTAAVIVERSIESVYLQTIIVKLEASIGGDAELRSSEFVGPQIGDELRDQGVLGLLTAFFLVYIYIAVQFQWKFSVGAIIGLVHDTIVTLGFFALFQWDFDLTVLAAVLAMIGYSLNDTIVVSDRIRENFRVLRQMDPHEIINISITQTLGRTLMTSITVLVVLLCLYFIAGEVLQGFSLALMIGVLAGTYSSVYVCANITAALGVTKEDLMPKPKGEEFEDGMP